MVYLNKKKTVFVGIKPEGFRLNEKSVKELRFIISRENMARKLWKKTSSQRSLSCFSSNGINSKDGTLCSRCPDLDDCQLKLRLYFEMNNNKYCLELPGSSMENYLEYKDGINNSRLNINKIITLARVVNRGYWGEITFTPVL